MSAPNPIRVLALMEAFTVGGPAKNIIEFGLHGARTGEVELSLVTYQRGGNSQTNPFVDAARAAGLTVHILTEKRRFDLAPRQQLRELADRCKPDILQSHNIKSHLLIRSLGLQKRFPWVVFQHGYTATDFKDRIYNQVDRFSLPAAHRVVAVCGAFAKRLERRGVAANRIRVQHNAVRPPEALPDEAIARLRAQWNLGEKLVILTVGRLSAEKGHVDLLHAAASLSRRNLPPWQLVIAGDGPDRESLQQLATRLDIKDSLVFAGHQSDLKPYYAMADLLALPSHTEGSPNVVLEAMAAGLPIAACAVGGVPEILTDAESGLLVPARQPEAMAEALARLLSAEPLRRQLGAAAQQHSHTFTPEARFRSILAIYKDLLGI